MNSSTKTLLILPSLLTLVLLGTFVYEISYIKAKNQNTAVLQGQILALSESDNQVQVLHSIQKTYSTELAALEKIALTKDNLVTFLELAERTGKNLGLETKITAVNLDQGTKTSKSKNSNKNDTVHIQIESDGLWANSLVFVRALESLPYQVHIDNLTLTLRESKLWHLSATLTLYSFN